MIVGDSASHLPVPVALLAHPALHAERAHWRQIAGCQAICTVCRGARGQASSSVALEPPEPQWRPSWASLGTLWRVACQCAPLWWRTTRLTPSVCTGALTAGHTHGVRLARRAARTQDIVWPAGGAGGRETVLGHQARDTQRRRGPGIAARGALRPPTTEHPFAASRWRSKFSQGIHHWNLLLALSREISYQNIIIHFSQLDTPVMSVFRIISLPARGRRLRRPDLIICLSA